MSFIRRRCSYSPHDFPGLLSAAGVSRVLIALICGLAGVASAAEPLPYIQQGVSPLLLLEQHIATASERPEFLSLWQGAEGELLLPVQQPQLRYDASGGSPSPVSSFAGQDEDERPGEIWEQHVRPPHHTAGTHKPREHQHQHSYGSAGGGDDKPTVKEEASGSPSASQPSAAAAEAATAAAADAAQTRQPVEVGGRYPLDSGHPPTGWDSTSPRRLKPMRTLAYGNIHQTAYYFAGESQF